MYACAGRCGRAHAYLGLESLNLSVLVLQLRAKLIGRHLLSLHDLDQVDVLLHQDLTLDDDVRVARRAVREKQRRGAGGYIWRFVLVQPLAFLILNAEKVSTKQQEERGERMEVAGRDQVCDVTGAAIRHQV